MTDIDPAEIEAVKQALLDLNTCISDHDIERAILAVRLWEDGGAFRAKLAEQCGKTLAAEHQRDAARAAHEKLRSAAEEEFVYAVAGELEWECQFCKRRSENTSPFPHAPDCPLAPLTETTR